MLRLSLSEGTHRSLPERISDMEYFMYSPLDMSVEEAFRKAALVLTDTNIAIVRPNFVHLVNRDPNSRLEAIPGMYLVRVEADGSLRTVHQNLD
jgi:hypothetical protein